MSNIQRMTAHIEQEARHKAEAILSEARQEAQRVSRAGRIQTQERRAEILEEYRLRAQEAREQVQSELRSESKHLWLAARQELIEAVLEAARTLFVQRSEAEEMNLLERVFRHNMKTAGGERPTVLVPPERLAAARALLGQEADVEAGDFEHGFVLSFFHFNANYQSRELFHFWRNSLEALAAQYLFGGDGHETPGS